MIPSLSSSRSSFRPRLRIRSQARHRKPGRSVLLVIASATGVAAIVLAVLASVPGLFA